MAKKKPTKKEIKQVHLQEIKEILNDALDKSPQEFMYSMHAVAFLKDVHMDMHIKNVFEGLDAFGLKFVVELK